MARNATPAPTTREVAINEAAVADDVDAANSLAAIRLETDQRVTALAEHLGYQGALSVGALEDGIRFYQRRTVEAVLELGKHLLLLKEMTPHGDFAQRLELLGFADRTAQRFMQAAAKTAKSANLALLSTQVKSSSAFLELVTHDEDELEELAGRDDIDRLSASELKAALRESREEKAATDQLLAEKNKRIDQLKAAQKRINQLPADDVLRELQREATGLMNDALGAIRGGLRQALAALAANEGGAEVDTLFMAGLVGQVQVDLNNLRTEFDLPDVSRAADQVLAAEMAEWAKS